MATVKEDLTQCPFTELTSELSTLLLLIHIQNQSKSNRTHTNLKWSKVWWFLTEDQRFMMSITALTYNKGKESRKFSQEVLPNRLYNKCQNKCHQMSYVLIFHSNSRCQWAIIHMCSLYNNHSGNFFPLIMLIWVEDQWLTRTYLEDLVSWDNRNS